MTRPRSVAHLCEAIVMSAVLLVLSTSCGTSDGPSGQASSLEPPASQPSTDAPAVMTPGAQPDTAAPEAFSGLTPTIPVAERLVGSKWILLSYGPANDQRPALPNAPATLDFNTVDSFEGLTGCKEYHALYTIDGSTFAITEVQQTKRACVEQGAQQQEAAFIAALGSAATLATQGDMLTIGYDGGELRFVFRPSLVPSPMPSALTGTSWQLVAFETGVTTTSVLTREQMTAEFESEEVYGRVGCNLYEARTIVNGQTLMLVDFYETVVGCDEAVLRQAATFLAALESTQSFQLEGDTLLLTYDEGVLRFLRMQPPPERYAHDPRPPAPTPTPDPHPPAPTPASP
jgi:heat shock protein HslJ